MLKKEYSFIYREISKNNDEATFLLKLIFDNSFNNTPILRI